MPAGLDCFFLTAPLLAKVSEMIFDGPRPTPGTFLICEQRDRHSANFYNHPKSEAKHHTFSPSSEIAYALFVVSRNTGIRIAAAERRHEEGRKWQSNSQL